MLITMIFFLFPSCSMLSGGKAGDISTKDSIASNDEAYPSPGTTNWEQSGNATGARFNMNLKEYTDSFNKMYNSLGGGSEQINFSNWQKLKEKQQDENGVYYDYYYYADDKAVLTATVETESQKIMNLGCGTTVSVFVNEGNENYQTIVLTMTGIMACVAGGYSVENVKFFSDLYVDAISGSNNSFWYNNCIYLLSVEEDQSNDQSSMLFRIVAATDNIEDDWHLVNYKTYMQENTESATDSSLIQSTEKTQNTITAQ